VDDPLLHKTLWRRALASSGDATIFWIVALFWNVPTSLVASRGWHTAGLAVLEFAFVGYRVLAHTITGQTVGKRLAGIRVVSTAGSYVSLRQALVREGLLLTFGAVPLLAAVGHALFGERLPRLLTVSLGMPSALALVALSLDPVIAVLHSRRRALHDLIAGTVVVRCAKVSSAA
jgi:uncharacterized RDD family membrane protein YckC